MSMTGKKIISTFKLKEGQVYEIYNQEIRLFAEGQVCCGYHVQSGDLYHVVGWRKVVPTGIPSLVFKSERILAMPRPSAIIERGLNFNEWQHFQMEDYIKSSPYINASPLPSDETKLVRWIDWAKKKVGL